jgi:Histidine kinase-like ATPase domain
MTRTGRFAHAPESVPSARRFAAEALVGEPDEVLDAVGLMVSELASNCVRHTDSDFELTVIKTGAQIRVQATDRAGGEPTMRLAGPADPHGRGLLIIDMLASSWGVDAVPEGGKTVWFTLAGRTPAAVGSG